MIFRKSPFFSNLRPYGLGSFCKKLYHQAKPKVNFLLTTKFGFMLYSNPLMEKKENKDTKLLSMLKKMEEIELDEFPAEWPPLMVAVIQQKREIAKLLIENGASVNFSDSKGLTPLMLASVLNDVQMMQLLIQQGADVNARAKNGFSAIIYAIYANATDAVKTLSENKADIKVSIRPKTLEEKHTFSETLEFYIRTFSLDGLAAPSLIYKKCGISKQLFSKLRSNQKSTYHPHKETVLQLAVGLRLTLSQTENLLESAGYIFEEKNPTDEIFKKHIKNLDFDIMAINEEIWKKTGKPLLK